MKGRMKKMVVFTVRREIVEDTKGVVLGKKIITNGCVLESVNDNWIFKISLNIYSQKSEISINLANIISLIIS